MIPLLAWDKKRKKWDIFPYHMLEDLDDGYKGFDLLYWRQSELDEINKILKKYPQCFVYKSGSKLSPALNHYVFLPGLPKPLQRRLRWEAVRARIAKQIPDMMVMLLLLIGIGSIIGIFVMGIIAIIKGIIGLY